MRAFINRILSRLLQAEADPENTPHLQDDYRIARLTVAFAARGSPQPFVEASYAVLGVHPNKVWPAILKRRKSLLGAKYSLWFDEHDQLRSADELREAIEISAPKKPVRSVQSADGEARRKVAGAEWRWWEPAPERSVSLKSERRGSLSSAPLSSRRPSMAASTQVAYLNSQATPIGKTQALSPFRLRHFIRYSGLPKRYKDVLLESLTISGDAGIVMWPATLGLMNECGVARRTVQHRRKRMLELGIIRRRRDANTWSDCPKCGAKGGSGECVVRTARVCGACGHIGVTREEFRRPATYEPDLDVISNWKRLKELRAFGERSYKEFKADNRNKQSRPAAKPAPAVEQKAYSLPVKREPEKQPDANQEGLKDREISRLRRRMKTIVRKFEKSAAMYDGKSLTFRQLIKEACDDEFLDFERAWKFALRVWKANLEAFRADSAADDDESPPDDPVN